MPGTTLLIGTRKAFFIYRSDPARERWELSPPMLKGTSVYQSAVDTRRRPARILLAANHWAWGRSVARSDDGGQTWEQRSPGLGFPQDMGITIDNVWGITPGHPAQPGVVWAGTQPAGLFRSDDWGESWQPVDDLNRLPDRKFWHMTGGGQSALTAIELDPREPNRLYINIATGGCYCSEDGGKTWEPRWHTAIATTPEVREMFEKVAEMFPEMAEQFPAPEGVDPLAANEFHRLRLDPKNPDRLWGQAHVGVFRSDNGGRQWHDVTKGLPSFHGFPLAVTKQGRDAVFVVPLEMEADNFRVVNGQFAVYRTADAGATWERLTRGLPGPHDYQSVYRDAMDTDGIDPEGVFLGTTNGEVWYGREWGESWVRLPGTLPPILSVTAIPSDLL
ncbi:sialidase family protein [Tepidiforma sp.]|jgi:photosystem II stability/assembly factor-like uncharacterized protein|uniref:WD40/YVTN/BNR-like repeat-containing protein n=1 Tax=Tepidiforma sp. TaxID=2682230 RepID=UPI00261DD9D4|nr:sialidase family protein [Tepidiforma sp.]MCX7618635.1 hypothetical protein [Tepidiforma sp.]